jgi:hypothetical protein
MSSRLAAIRAKQIHLHFEISKSWGIAEHQC